MLLGGSEALDKGESARAAAEGQLPGEVLYSRYRPEAGSGEWLLGGFAREPMKRLLQQHYTSISVHSVCKPRLRRV